MYFFSAQLTITRDKMVRSENSLVEEQKCVSQYEYKREEHSDGEEAEEDMSAKEKIMNSLEGNLCVQTEEAKKGSAEDAAIIKVRFDYAH
jgi:hypothetical protein